MSDDKDWIELEALLAQRKALDEQIDPIVDRILDRRRRGSRARLADLLGVSTEKLRLRALERGLGV